MTKNNQKIRNTQKIATERKYRFSYRMTIATITCAVPLFSVIYNSVAPSAGVPFIMGGTVFWGVIITNMALGIIALVHRWPNVNAPLYTEVKV